MSLYLIQQTINDLDTMGSNEEKENYIRRYLEECTRSTQEIDVIFKHFLNDGMLSEIIAPSVAAEKSGDENLTRKSIEALQVLDGIITKEKQINKGFKDALLTNFMLKMSQQDKIENGIKSID